MKILITYLQVLWRHFLAIAIFVGAFVFVVCVEPWAFPRLMASLVVLLDRLLGFVLLLFGRKPTSPYLLSYVSSMGELPAWLTGFDPASFFSSLLVYFRLLFTKGQFLGFLVIASSSLALLIRLAMVVVFAFMILNLWFSSYFEESNLPWYRSSEQLVGFKRVVSFLGRVIKGVWRYLVWFLGSFWALPLLLFLFYGFNVFSYLIDFAGLCLYFFASLDFVSLVDFVLSLAFSFFFSFSFVPVWFLAFAFYVFFRLFCFKYADGFISGNLIPACQAVLKNLTGVFTLIIGKMRAGKTKLMTLFAIFQSLNDRQEAYRIMRKYSRMFPDFPWQAFENVILGLSSWRKGCRRKVFNIQTAEEYATRFYSFLSGHHLNHFHYDVSIERVSYFDGCKSVSLLHALKCYSQAFYLYARYDTFIASNYSIRTDELLTDKGHLILWDDDLFHRDNRDMLDFSTFSHIIWYDSLRLGLKVDPKNRFNSSAGPGIYCITEDDKERGNRDTNSGVKVSDGVANPKNDYFSYSIKLGGHIASVDNVNFFKMFGDMQYSGALSLTDVSVAQSIFTVDQKNVSERNAVPFWWIEPIIIEKVLSLSDRFYQRYRFEREDSTLVSWLVARFAFFAGAVADFIRNRYGYDKIGLMAASCTSSGDLVEGETVYFYAPYFLAFSDRFQSNCMDGFLNDGKNLAICGFTDLPKFSGVENTKAEWEAQGSYVVSDLMAGSASTVSKNGLQAKARIATANEAIRPGRDGKGRAVSVLKGGSGHD